MAAAAQPHGMAPRGPVEGLSHGRPPVDNEGLHVGAGHGQAADVEGLPPWRAVTLHGLGVTVAVPDGALVDAAEAEGLVP